MDLHSKKVQSLIMAFLLVALGGWFVLRGGNSISLSNLTEVSSDPIEKIIGRELLVSLEKMKGVNLDVSFVNDPVYQSLYDMTVEIPELPAGRRDPFAPISEVKN
jgi:hypothetical protein